MKAALHTKLCDLFSIKYPIVLAGMNYAAGPNLAAAVSNAGGLGMIGGGICSPDDLSNWIKETRKLTDKPFGVDLLVPSPKDAAALSVSESELVNLPKEQVAFVNKLKQEFGIGEPKKPLKGAIRFTKEYYRKQFEVILDERPAAFAAALGNPAWAVPECHAHGIKVIGLVGNVRNARQVAEGGADIIVAQGHEAGGHTGKIGTMALVPQVVDAVSPTLVLAAGGIADGRGLVAALALGAVGVWCGSAFLLCDETSVYPPSGSLEEWDYARWQVEDNKEHLIAATEENTIVSRSITGKTARWLKNPWILEWEKPGNPATVGMPLQSFLIRDTLAGIRDSHVLGLTPNAAGQIIGMLRERKKAAQVIEDMVNGATKILKSFQQN